MVNRIINHLRDIFSSPNPTPENRFQKRHWYKRRKVKNRPLNKTFVISPEHEKRLRKFIAKLDPIRGKFLYTQEECERDPSLKGKVKSSSSFYPGKNNNAVEAIMSTIKKKTSSTQIWHYLSYFIDDKNKEKRLKQFIRIWR